MRPHPLLLVGVLSSLSCTVERLGLGSDDTTDASVAADASSGYTCTGLGCYQVSCMNGGSTTVSGTVTAPNGKDPVYDAVVYVPTSTAKFPPTVQCEVCGQTLGGTALVSTTTAIDGTFTLSNVPATAKVPIVVQKGRFRRMLSIDIPPCTNTPLSADQARLPKNQQEGDLPHIAVGVSDFDQIECVLHSIGIDQAEFTSPSGTGAVHLYANSSSISGQPTMHSLLMDPATMATYQLIFIGCAVPTFASLGDGPTVTTNLYNYVNTGGRLYVTDYSYDYMEQVPQFSPYVFFSGGGSMTMPQPAGAAEGAWAGQTFTATVGDPNLAAWLKLVGKSTNGQVPIEAAYALAVSTAADPKTYPSTTWVHGAVQGLDSTDRPHTVTFDYNSCGKVLWSAYHTREPGGAQGFGTFPSYCLSNPSDPSTMIAQEKILEYLVFQISACVNNVPG